MLILPGALSAATVITLTADTTNALGQFSTTFGNELTDTFAYDPLNPTFTSPVTAFSGTTHYHPDEAPVVPEATFIIINEYSLSHIVTAAESTIVFDIWGRTGSGNSLDRDDSYQVELFDNVGTSLGVQAGGIITDSYDRVTFTGIAAGTVISDLVFTGFDSELDGAGAANNNNFTIAELRLAAIPEPSSALLLGVSGLALLARRRR